MERKLLYIVNPISGTKNKKSLQELIQEQTTKAGLAFEIFPSVANGDYSFLTEIIKDKKFVDFNTAVILNETFIASNKLKITIFFIIQK